LSVVINAILIWYAHRLTKQFVFFSDSVKSLEGSLKSFDDHLNGVHKLEMFYGDDTLGALIAHSKQVVEVVGDFYEQFTLDENLDMEESDEDG